MKIETKKNIFLSGIFLLSFILFNILISTTLFIFDISIKNYFCIIAYIFSVLLTIILMKKIKTVGKKFEGSIITILVPTLIIIVSIFSILNSLEFGIEMVVVSNHSKQTEGDDHRSLSLHRSAVCCPHSLLCYQVVRPKLQFIDQKASSGRGSCFFPTQQNGTNDKIIHMCTLTG